MSDDGRDHGEIVALESARRARRDPPAHLARGVVLPARWTPDKLGLPVEWPCPVVPLGIGNPPHLPRGYGGRFFLIDSLGQVRSLSADQFGRRHSEALFAAAPNYPRWAWPRRDEYCEPDVRPPIRRFDTDLVREALFKACSLKGVIDDPTGGRDPGWPWDQIGIGRRAVLASRATRWFWWGGTLAVIRGGEAFFVGTDGWYPVNEADVTWDGREINDTDARSAFPAFFKAFGEPPIISRLGSIRS
jgi:hypothetical protein